MKKLLFFLIGILLFSCNQTSKSSKESKNKNTEFISNSEKSFDWLIGKWKRTNEEQGKETFEIWKKTSESEYKGIGYIMQNNDTIWQEEMLLSNTDRKWKLKIKNPEEEAITFKNTDLNDNSFSFQNHDIDFPNEISYRKNGNKISATVAGGDTKIEFEFEKLIQ